MIDYYMLYYKTTYMYMTVHEFEMYFLFFRSLNPSAQSLNREKMSSSDQVVQLSLPSSCFMADSSES